MNINKEELVKIKDLLEKSNRILLISHKSPDGDTIGSAMAFYNVLKNLNKEVKVVCKDSLPDVFNFLPNKENFYQAEPTEDYDVYIIVDAAAHYMTGFHDEHPYLFDKSKNVINIDHHPSNDFFGKYNIVMPEMASTTMILYYLFTELNYKIDISTATCLLTGLYTDTGSLMHSNTNADTLRVASKLLAKGANLRQISKDIFNTLPISTMHLWGRVLKNINQNSEGITMSVIKQKDFDETGAEYNEMTGVVDYVNAVPNSKYSVILTEKGSQVKASLRTLTDGISVSDIAAEYGGGGHEKAAGFTINGHLEKEVKWKVIED